MKALLLIALLALTACASPHTGPGADVSSTLVAHAVRDVTEANPLMPDSLAAGSVLSLGVRAAIIQNRRGKQDCETVAGWTNAIGWGATCSNLAVAAGAAPMVSLPLLMFCSITVHKTRADDTAAWCGHYTLTDLSCTLDNLPVEARAARCIDNHLAWK